MSVIESYRLLLGAVLDRSFLGHEGHDLAVADFIGSDDRAVDVLHALIEAQPEGEQ